MRTKGAKYVDAEVGDGLAQIRRAAPPGTRVRQYRQPGGLWSPAVVKAMAEAIWAFMADSVSEAG